jgi:hypothetical protein
MEGNLLDEGSDETLASGGAKIALNEIAVQQSAWRAKFASDPKFYCNVAER